MFIFYIGHKEQKGENLQKNCVIYDTDKQYGKRLVSAISSHKNLPFHVSLFTCKDEMAAFFDCNTADITVVSEECFEYEDVMTYSKKVLVLTEEDCGSFYKNIKSQENIKKTYKYQSVDSILREMIQFVGNGEEKTQEIELIGVYSPAGEAVRTKFALSYARILAEDNKTLYCNLEEFSGLEEILAVQGKQTLSDIMYYYRYNKGQITENMKQVIVSYSGIDYIPPTGFAQDIGVMETKELAQMFLELAQECGYKKVVLEISSAVKEQWKLIFACGRVYMPVSDNYFSKQKASDFEKYLLMAGMENLWNRIEKVLIKDMDCISKSTYIGSREDEEMNGFVKQLFM